MTSGASIAATVRGNVSVMNYDLPNHGGRVCARVRGRVAFEQVGQRGIMSTATTVQQLRLYARLDVFPYRKQDLLNAAAEMESFNGAALN